MYHRFGEEKYPSTNIGIAEFRSHIKMIEEEGLKFIDPRNLANEIKIEKKKERYYLQLMTDLRLFIKTLGLY